MISLIVLLLEFYLPFNICWQKRFDLKKLFFKPTFIKTLTNIVVYKIVWKSWEWQTRLQFNFVTWEMNSNKVADFVFIQSLFISHFQSQVPRWHSSPTFMSCCLQKLCRPLIVYILFCVSLSVERRRKVCFARSQGTHALNFLILSLGHCVRSEMFAVFWNYVTDVRILLNQSRIAIIVVYSISFKMLEALYKY